jgi:hypothetical protein
VSRMYFRRQTSAGRAYLQIVDSRRDATRLAGRRLMIYQPGCSTDTETVPSEIGVERTINITRCY